VTAPLIELKNVTKRFGEKTVLDRANLTIFEGDITTIIGKSGEGKSVLLKHIIGLLRPDEGEILFNGKQIRGLTRKERKSFKQQISYMFQNNALFDSLTVFENIALPLRWPGHLSVNLRSSFLMSRPPVLTLSAKTLS
jgi:phospholipid/cholesterol/gamma-HCH transport system ATP-binding protein